jgi:hypothetical protein
MDDERFVFAGLTGIADFNRHGRIGRKCLYVFKIAYKSEFKKDFYREKAVY